MSIWMFGYNNVQSFLLHYHPDHKPIEKPVNEPPAKKEITDSPPNFQIEKCMESLPQMDGDYEVSTKPGRHFYDRPSKCSILPSQIPNPISIQFVEIPY